MKQNKKKKSAITKGVKPKSPSVSTAANEDIIGLLTMLVQKLTSFESKLDMVIKYIQSPKQQPLAVSLPERNRSRPMYKAVCADCGVSCEVPFKPKGDRLVYCKQCFTQRKSKGIFKPPEADKPRKDLPLNIAPIEKPKAVKPAKPPKKATKKSKSSIKRKKAKR